MEIKELKKSETGILVNGLYLCTKVTKETTRNGKSYATVTLQDQSGEIAAKFWGTDILDDGVVGLVLDVRLQIQDYNGNHSYILLGYSKTDENPSQYSNSFVPNVDNMKKYLTAVIKEITDKRPDYRVVIKELFQKGKLEDFYTYPAAKSMHHDEKYGLLFHTTSIMHHADSLIKSTEKCYGIKINRELVMLAVLLHDFFKTKEYSINEVGKGDISKYFLIGHIVMAAQFVGYLYYENKIDEDTYLELTHIINSHHGQLEYGSPTVPSTVEAFIVHIADLFDSRIYMFKSEYNGLEEGDMSEKKNFGLGTSVYKPKSRA